MKLEKSFYRISTLKIGGSCAAILVSLFFICEGYAQSKPIEFFSNGVEYKSIEDYKIVKIKNEIKELFPTMETKRLEEVYSNCLKVYTVQELEQFSSERLRQIIEEQRSGDEDVSNKDNLTPDVNEMQQILKDYQDNHKEDGPLSIDPQKVKTIIISPQETKENSSSVDTSK